MAVQLYARTTSFKGQANLRAARQGENMAGILTMSASARLKTKVTRFQSMRMIVKQSPYLVGEIHACRDEVFFYGSDRTLHDLFPRKVAPEKFSDMKYVDKPYAESPSDHRRNVKLNQWTSSGYLWIPLDELNLPEPLMRLVKFAIQRSVEKLPTLFRSLEAFVVAGSPNFHNLMAAYPKEFAEFLAAEGVYWQSATHFSGKETEVYEKSVSFVSSAMGGMSPWRRKT